MGIDGSEIKRKREVKEKKEAEVPSTTKQTEPTPVIPTQKLSTIGRKLATVIGFLVGGIGFLVAIAIVVKLFEPSFSTKTVNTINNAYGNVCHAELNGIFSKTLQIDWTSRTNKLYAIKVLAEVGSVKERLYDDGVRYFQFPNDAGTYNVIDWKNGDRKSISDRTQYYFPD